MTTTDPTVVDRLLDVLRRWDWEHGHRRLREQFIAGADAPPVLGAFFSSWSAVERGDYGAADHGIAEMAAVPELAGWALFVAAFAAFRQKQYGKAVSFLDKAESHGSADDSFRGAILHVRGAIRFHLGESEAALVLLKQAFQLLRQEDPEHLGLGRVLDTLGMVYAATSNFHAAREFYLRSLARKQNQSDIAGEALSNGQLGRLCADWGLLRSARAYFERDRELARAIDDARGAALMANALGQVALAEGNLDDAAAWLDRAIRDSEGRPGWEVTTGFTHKDRALVHLAAGEVPDLSVRHLAQADTLFRGLAEPFVEGLAHVDRARGIWHRRRGDWQASLDRLRDARRHFEQSREATEIVRTRLEIARTERARGDRGAPLTLDLRHIVEAAEATRRVMLLREAEAEWREADPVASAHHLFRRARGRSEPEDVTDLMSGVNEGISALFLDIRNSTVFTLGHDPSEVMLTLNQLIAELAEVLKRCGGAINCYRGDGFLALFRGENHAVHAVEAALDMNDAVARFNEPREILDLALLGTRIGIGSGPAFLGNMGTYDKIGFTAIGAPVNLGARIESQATPGEPSVSEETWRAVRHRFACRAPDGRPIDAKGFGAVQVRVWDVTGRV